MESKYASQIKHLRKNYKKFTIDLKPEVLEKYREVCQKNSTTPTTEIKRFISQYIEDNK